MRCTTGRRRQHEARPADRLIRESALPDPLFFGYTYAWGGAINFETFHQPPPGSLR